MSTEIARTLSNGTLIKQAANLLSFEHHKQYCCILFSSFHPHSFHTRAHTHMLTHCLCISNYSQTRGDWHYWRGLDHSLVQLPFQSLHRSIFWNYTTSPTPLRLSPPLSLTQHLPPPSPPLAELFQGMTLWKRAAAAKPVVATLR